MSNILTLEILGTPVAKARHRTSGKRTYNPQSELEAAIQWEIKKQLQPGYELTKAPLILAIDAYFPRPKSHYGTGKNVGILKPSAPKYHTNKPDHDNILKFYLDCMNKLVFQDDTQVVAFDRCGKLWTHKDKPGRVKIRLRELQ